MAKFLFTGVVTIVFVLNTICIVYSRGEILCSTNHVNITSDVIKVRNVKVFYRKGQLPDDVEPTNTSVLFLHGAAFSSKTWLNLGTIACLTNAGHDVIAIDLPGYGMTKTRYSGNRVQFLVQLMRKLNVRNPILVSPSMSGSYSIPMVQSKPGKLGGFVPIAPVTSVNVEKLKTIQNLPTLIIYGEKDFGGRRTSDNLSNIPGSIVKMIPNGRHPAYLDNPVLFHSMMLEFLQNL